MGRTCADLDPELLRFLGRRAYYSLGSESMNRKAIVRTPLSLAISGLFAVGLLDCQIQNQPEDGQWTMAAKNYASTRFSSLAEINTTNVKNLKLAWSFSTGLTKGHEAAPLVVNNTMYVVTPWPNLLYALDLTKPGGPVKWTYEPQPSPSAQGVACCDVVNRGAAYYKGRIYYNTLDVHTVAVDATQVRKFGKPSWATSILVNPSPWLRWW